ncbi:MAG: hypothetical protein ACSLEM_04870 [Candidatus Malihini olakiniferum]
MTLAIYIAAIVYVAITHFFWQRLTDWSDNIRYEMVEAKDIEINVPRMYTMLLFTSIIRVRWCLLLSSLIKHINRYGETNCRIKILFSSMVSEDIRN